MALFVWRAGRLTAQNGGFRPGQNKDLKIRYVAPADAKKARTYDQQQPQQEQMEVKYIDLEKFFKLCFNLNAKVRGGHHPPPKDCQII
jgi:hypothetical protein